MITIAYSIDEKFNILHYLIFISDKYTHTLLYYETVKFYNDYDLAKMLRDLKWYYNTTNINLVL